MIERHKKLGLRVKFSGWTVVVIIFIVSITSTFLIYHERKALRQEREARGDTIIRNLDNLSIETLILRDELAVHSLLNGIVQSEPDVLYAQIKDNRQEVFLASALEVQEDLRQIIKELRFPEGPEILKQYLDVPPYPPIIDISKLIFVKEKQLGKVRIGVSEEGINSTLRALRNNVILIASSLIILLLVVSYIIISHAVRPIEYLSERARAIGEGDLTTRIKLEQEDELGQLAGTLDSMAQKIKESQEQLVEKEKLEKEMEIARDIQQMLIPQQFPSLPGFSIGAFFKPAELIGGDYYDLFEIGRGRFGCVIADVSGKSISGAIIMALIRTMLRAEAMEKESPGEVLTRVNSLIKPDLKPRMYVTASYLILSPREKTVKFASAGHQRPIFYSESGKNAEILPGKGMALGISDDKFFRRVIEEHEVTLQRGDGLFIYSDGISEAFNPKQEEYGEERILNALKVNLSRKAEDIISALYEDLRQFIGSMNQSDDITMLSFKLEE
ncbi:MAG: SpoIIE family protein phosphatase [Deltaproteobacteria bacterium]|nr:MAG: SpoIIE family protein phosphatase [Deltaproteobacteria bacterium]